jgi:hypothetical protein
MMMMDFTVVCDAPTGCVFDLARRNAPDHYRLVASYLVGAYWVKGLWSLRVREAQTTQAGHARACTHLAEGPLPNEAGAGVDGVKVGAISELGGARRDSCCCCCC